MNMGLLKPIKFWPDAHMYILIDNSDDQKIVFYYYLKDKWLKRAFSRKTDLLVGLNKLLANLDCSTSKVKGLAVRLGVGRFTATRVAATLANTLGFALNIPVVGVGDLDLKKTLKSLRLAKPGKYVSATYSAGAHLWGKQEK